MRALPAAEAFVLAVSAVAFAADSPSTEPPSLQALQQKLAEREAANEALRQRIGAVEAMLASDVCTQGDAAAALLQTDEVPPLR